MKLKTILHFLQLVLLSNFFIWSVISFADQSQLSSYDQLTIAQKKYWNKLLHVDSNKNESRFDGEKFFISPVGKKNVGLEFDADVRAFAEAKLLSGWFNYPVQCVFRERYEFIKSLGLLSGAPITNCPMFDEWKKGLNAQSVTLVFSSSYPNNPSSLFGHTLIRLNQKNKTSDLLDYSISFSAIPDADDIGIVFGYKGLFGGYKGLIEVTKYYTKVNDYTNSESRDLLEYELNFSPVQLDRLINHVWEIYQTTYADYFFLSENCSSVLADIIAVALDEVEGINSHSKWYYLPSEMVKKLSETNQMIRSFVYRPSLKKQFQKMLEHLSLEEKNEFMAIRKSGIIPNDFSNIKIIDAIISYIDYTRYRTRNDLSESDKGLFRMALIRRSKLKGESVKYNDYIVTNRPEEEHEPRKFSTFIRQENSNSLIGLEYKNGYHNIMSRDRGFDPYSQFDFLYGSILIDRKSRKLNLDRLNIVDLISTHLFEFYDPQISWNAFVGIERNYIKNDDLIHHKLDVRATGGLSFLVTKNIVLKTLTGLYFEGKRYGPNIEMNALYSLGDQFKLGIFEELRFKIGDDFQNIFGLKTSYFQNINNEWQLEYKQISTLSKFDNQVKVLQANYGIYF